MQYYIRSIIILYAVTSMQGIIGADEKLCAYNTYDTIPITTQNIIQLSPQIPHEIKVHVDAWFNVPENRDLAIRLAHTPKPFNAETFKEKRNADRDHLIMLQDEKGIVRSLSRYNYALQPLYSAEQEKHAQNFIIKICGLSAKMGNLLYDAGIDLNEEAKKFPGWYHTAFRM